MGKAYSWKDGPKIELTIAPGLDIGILFVFAIGSLGVYGVILGGWASNSKYSLLGGLRSSAQLISYEIPLGLSVIGVLLFAGSLRMETIIETQASTGWWWAAVQPIGFVVFLISGCAEASRLPFDLPECEQELVGGYHTEYTAMKFGMFAFAEYLHLVTVAFLTVNIYFGGWHFWGLTPAESEIGWLQAILRVLILNVKMLLVIFFFMWIRWSWPRFRYDQLMNVAWKVMIPLGLVNLLVCAVCQEFMSPENYLGRAIMGWVTVAGCVAYAALFAGPAATSRTSLTSRAA